MIHSVTVTNYLGESLSMELRRPEKSGLLVRSIDGLGPSKATINSTEVSTNDGAIFNSARISSRNITIKLVFWDSGAESVEDIRQKTYKYFPGKKPLVLTIRTDNRLLEISGYTESNEPDIFSSQEGTQISIVCPDPSFYSAGEIGVTSTVFSGTESLFEFEFSNESVTDGLIEFGSVMTQQEATVYYEGDLEIGMTLYLHALGTVVNPVLYNARTREIMKIDTSRIADIVGDGFISGDDIVINTTKGNKSIFLIRSGVTYNILNCLDKNADWFSLVKGDNIFAFSADSGVEGLQLTIQNQTIYEGV